MSFKKWLENDDPDKGLSDAELARRWKQQDEEMDKEVTLNSPIGALWGSKQHCGMYGSMLIAWMEWAGKPLREIIKSTYEKMKQAIWNATAEDYGYPKPSQYRNALGTDQMSKMNDAEKRIFIHDRAMGALNNAIHELYHCLRRERSDMFGKKYPKPPLPEPVVKWLEYIYQELLHDQDMIQHNDRQEADIKAQNERWATQAQKQEEDAQKLAKALYKARGRLSGWEDASEKDALTTARAYMKASPHERGQYQRAIHDIARKTLSQRLSAKSYYMKPEEAKQFLSQALQVNLSAAPAQQVADILNKTIGITDSQDIMGTDWGENVHPALSAGDLGPAGGLRFGAAAELRERLTKGNDKVNREIYWALDAENRKLFFKET